MTGAGPFSRGAGRSRVSTSPRTKRPASAGLTASGRPTPTIAHTSRASAGVDLRSRAESPGEHHGDACCGARRRRTVPERRLVLAAQVMAFGVEADHRRVFVVSARDLEKVGAGSPPASPPGARDRHRLPRGRRASPRSPPRRGASSAARARSEAELARPSTPLRTRSLRRFCAGSRKLLSR